MKQRNSSHYNRLRGENSGETLGGKPNNGARHEDRCRLLSANHEEHDDNDYMSINSNCNNCENTCNGEYHHSGTVGVIYVFRAFKK